MIAHYKLLLQRFGLSAVLIELINVIANRFVRFNLESVFLVETPIAEERNQDVRIVSREELYKYAKDDHYNLSKNAIDHSLNNGDLCIGIFQENKLAAYNWYALKPYWHSYSQRACFNKKFACGYNAFTHPDFRGKSLRKILVSNAKAILKEHGKDEAIVAISWNNFISKKAGEKIGYKKVGWNLSIGFGEKQIAAYTSVSARFTGYHLKNDFIGSGNLETVEKDVDIQLIEHWHDFKAIKQEYTDFIDGDLSVESLYYHFDWMNILRRLYVIDNMSLHFLIVRKAGEIIGFAPLILETKPLNKGKLRRLFIWGGHRGTLNNVTPDFVCTKGSEEKVISALKQYFFNEAKRNWDIIEFRFYGGANATCDYIKKYFPYSRWNNENLDCYVMNLPDNKNELFPNVSSNRKKDLRRRLRKLNNDFKTIEFQCLNVMDDELLKTIATIHSNRQRSLSRRGAERKFLFENQKEKDVIQELFQISEHNQWLRIYLLSADKKIIAFIIDFLRPDSSISLLTAMDDDYASYSPSMLLANHVLEREFEQSETLRINYLPGKTSQKESFHNQHYATYQFYIINFNNSMSYIRIGLWLALGMTNKMIDFAKNKINF